MEELGPDFSATLLGELASNVPSWPLASEIVAPDWPYEETTLVSTVRRAWLKPMSQLTGHEFRTLISQGFGLAWLAAPALEVALKYPKAYFSNYEGELAYALLRNADEIHQVEPARLRQWLATDLTSLANIVEPEDDPEPSLLKPTFRELVSSVRNRFG